MITVIIVRTASELLEGDATARVDVLEDLLLQLDHVLLEVHHDTAQVRVLALEHLHLVLQLGDSLQLPFPALGRRHPVPLALPLQLLPFLVVHVHRAERGRVGHRLGLVLDLHAHRKRVVCKGRGIGLLVNMLNVVCVLREVGMGTRRG